MNSVIALKIIKSIQKTLNRFMYVQPRIQTTYNIFISNALSFKFFGKFVVRTGTKPFIKFTFCLVRHEKNSVYSAHGCNCSVLVPVT